MAVRETLQQRLARMKKKQASAAAAAPSASAAALAVLRKPQAEAAPLSASASSSSSTSSSSSGAGSSPGSAAGSSPPPATTVGPLTVDSPALAAQLHASFESWGEQWRPLLEAHGGADPARWRALLRGLSCTGLLDVAEQLRAGEIATELLGARDAEGKQSNRKREAYVQLWLTNAELQAADAEKGDGEARRTYKYMESEGIGTDCADFWVAWARLESARSETAKAEKALLKAIKRAAKPAYRVEEAWKELLSTPFPIASGSEATLRASAAGLTAPAKTGGGFDCDESSIMHRESEFGMSMTLGSVGHRVSVTSRSAARPEAVDESAAETVSFSRQRTSATVAPTPTRTLTMRQRLTESAKHRAPKAESEESSQPAMRQPDLDLAATPAPPAENQPGPAAAVAAVAAAGPEPAPLAPIVEAPRSPVAEVAAVAHAAPAEIAAAPQAAGDKKLVIAGTAYQKMGVIGRGGSCKVYKVLRVSDQEIFALKKIRVDTPSDEEFAPFMNEIALLNKLRGKDNIIELVDAAVDRKKGVVYMVFEYGDIDLHKLLHKQAGKPVRDNFTRLYWQQMIEAVHTIHEERIVHSDLKPANFLVVQGTLKLIDFGIANEIQSAETTNIVRDSQVGTINYMSPESLEPPSTRNAAFKVSRKSDTWSMGCILYQMVYGRPPFYAFSNIMQKIKEITDDNLVIDYPEQSDPLVVETLRRCLVKDPNERADMSELLRLPYVVGATGPAPASAPALDSASMATVFQLQASGKIDGDAALQLMQQLHKMEDISAELAQLTAVAQPAPLKPAASANQPRQALPSKEELRARIAAGRPPASN